METKKKYTAPEIGLVELNNEISLALESSPPEGPDETYNNVQSPFKQDAYIV